MDEVFLAGDGFTLISGGQSGADRAALDWAMEQGIRHGGWCPRRRKTEDGVLAECYRLQETPDAGYLQRTEWNVRDSDATLIFTLTDRLDGGSKRTSAFAESVGKPWLHVRPGVHPKYVARFLNRHGVRTLNVAGKRESSAPGIGDLVRQTLSQAVRPRPAIQ
ncbi:putative molybdenum carrier protein [Massilia sp. YIM B02763]|uniref:putative molybdenum carrier protein n=1 Tax=Massilia sp. YIM B02763 TaxID=3050130 RepID=UPI0025B72A8A|nr:putative molybdenum carrier protein [Massilia sp. YIM B02763]MDN4051747.1 putative molybdenum carrier protein [Massilia sp. YIM B02763]